MQRLRGVTHVVCCSPCCRQKADYVLLSRKLNHGVEELPYPEGKKPLLELAAMAAVAVLIAVGFCPCRKVLIEFQPRLHREIIIVRQTGGAECLPVRSDLRVDIGVVIGMLRTIAPVRSRRHVPSALAAILAVIELLPDF